MQAGERVKKRRRTRPPQRYLRQLAALWLPLALVAQADEAIDLRNAAIETLDNGLTLILLEDRRFPVVSVQSLYRVGARDEVTGKTGLAHFVEHMAFRDSANFPETGLVSRIYAAGGEWHGYTWIDQTTYFATAPKEELDLLLRIEADRMSRLRISEADIDAERGAVLAEMHMYENEPGSMLIDAVNFTSFLAHPYRNNTIGFESDIEQLEHRDVVEFYERHYHPANAVLVVVGDFDPAVAGRRVRELFANARRLPPTPLPRTREPPQDGLRRIHLAGAGGPPEFRIAYRAPSARNPDFPAFLVLQAVLGRSSGVNFLQNDWGTPVGGDAPLAPAADGVTTWYPPSAEDYVFVLGGTAKPGMSPGATESAVEEPVARLRQFVVSAEVLADAVREVQDALVFDVETTEDAAHQLAFFDGLGALEGFLALPGRVRTVTAGDVRRVARRYLQAGQRSIAWYLAGEPPAALLEPPPESALPPPGPLREPGREPVPPPGVSRLDGGLPIIVQPSGLSSTAELRVVYGPGTLAGASANDPVQGYSSVIVDLRPDELPAAIDAAAGFEVKPRPTQALSSVPATRLEEEFDRLMSAARAPGPPGPVLITVAGDVAIGEVRERLAAAFGGVRPQAPVAEAGALPQDTLTVRVGIPVAQAQFGYIVTAPGPKDPAADAWRLLLYVLSHGYEGRVGKKAISEAGLAYYIDSHYRADGTNAWVTLSTGVDPEKLDAFRNLLEAELARLIAEPPSADEVAEAKRHLLGRHRSAAQSNGELTGKLAREWLWYGELVTGGALEARLASVSREDVLGAVAGFVRGTRVVVVP